MKKLYNSMMFDTTTSCFLIALIGIDRNPVGCPFDQLGLVVDFFWQQKGGLLERSILI